MSGASGGTGHHLIAAVSGTSNTHSITQSGSVNTNVSIVTTGNSNTVSVTTGN
jgi:hypothetical protein